MKHLAFIVAPNVILSQRMEIILKGMLWKVETETEFQQEIEEGLEDFFASKTKVKEESIVNLMEKSL